jgi:type II secretory pathway component PulF
MAGIPKIKGAKKIAKTEVVPFTRQLASMIDSGMPILSTILTLEELCSNPEFKKVLTHLMDPIDG